MDPNVTLQRVLRLAQFDTSVFDEVRDDLNDSIPAIVVAAVSCLLAGIGAFLWWKLVADFSPDGVLLNTVVLGTMLDLVALAVGAVTVWVVLVYLYRVQVELRALFRTVGYASLPFALSVGVFIPVIWPVFAIVPLALMFVMMIYAVQSTTSADSSQVVLAAAAGFVAFVLVAGIFAQMADITQAPMGAGEFGLVHLGA